MSEPTGLERLVSIVLEDADTRVRREEDRSRNEAREILLTAEDHVTELRRAAKDLGRTRGSAAEAAAALTEQINRKLQDAQPALLVAFASTAQPLSELIIEKRETHQYR